MKDVPTILRMEEFASGMGQSKSKSKRLAAMRDPPIRYEQAEFVEGMLRLAAMRDVQTMKSMGECVG